VLRRARSKEDRTEKCHEKIMKEEEMPDSVLVRAYTLLNIAKGLKELAGRTGDAVVALCPDLIATLEPFLAP